MIVGPCELKCLDLVEACMGDCSIRGGHSQAKVVRKVQFSEDYPAGN